MQYKGVKILKSILKLMQLDYIELEILPCDEIVDSLLLYFSGFQQGASSKAKKFVRKVKSFGLHYLH